MSPELVDLFLFPPNLEQHKFVTLVPEGYKVRIEYTYPLPEGGIATLSVSSGPYLRLEQAVASRRYLLQQFFDHDTVVQFEFHERALMLSSESEPESRFNNLHFLSLD